MFAIEYLDNIFSKYQTINCTNKQRSYQNVDPQPCLFMVTSGAEHKAGRQVWAWLGDGSTRNKQTRTSVAFPNLPWTQFWPVFEPFFGISPEFFAIVQKAPILHFRDP